MRGRWPIFALSFAVSLALNAGAGQADMAVSVQQDISAYLMRAIQVCWIMPADTRGVARIQISLNKDGSLAGPPRILGPVTPSPDKIAEAAVRAIVRCAPFSRLTSYSTHYDLWRDVVLTFKPETPPGGPPAADTDDLKKLIESYKKTK